MPFFVVQAIWGRLNHTITLRKENWDGKSEGDVITNLIPKELIVQVLRVRSAWEFAPDTDQGERDLSRHVL